jgi:malate dehydrogenase (oxaloacetate-decarboxylating)
MDEIKVVVNGVGAGGIACAKMLMAAGATNIIGVDTSGIVYRGRDNRGNKAKDDFAEISNPDNIEGDLARAMQGADVFLGLSAPNTVTPKMVSDMNDKPIVFAMANPDPEIWPEELKGIAGVMATGRSDYANQINNALCFPGMFRGALDVRATTINEEMKFAAAQAIAAGVPDSDLNEDYIIPGIFDLSVVRRVAKEVAAAAQKTGVARKKPNQVKSYSPPKARR